MISPGAATGERSLGTIGWSTAIVGPLAVSTVLLFFRAADGRCRVPSDDRALAVARADQLGAVLAAAAHRT